MWGLTGATRVYLRSGATDLRLGFDGLSAFVKTQLGQDLLSGNIFVFCNRGRTRVKVLTWDGSGLWLCSKRLERGTFKWPQTQDEEVEPAALGALLTGLEVEKQRNWFRK
jgi:transposase